MRPLLVIAVVVAVVTVGFLGPSGHAAEAVIDLHRVNWQAATLPGRVCGASRPIHLRHGRAYVKSHRWRNLRRIEVADGWSPVVYGDLDGDGVDEAAVGVFCSNGGGTADSVLAYARVVYRAGRTSASAIGVLTPHWQPKNQLPTLLTVVLRRGRAIGREAFYGRRDGTCCPSGRAKTVWTYGHGKFELSSSRITRRALR
jgi:hypothetical protein